MALGMFRRVRRRAGSEEGAELIEFSLTLPLLLLIVLGIIEFGFMFQEYEVVTNAAREGARIAILPAPPMTPAARVNQYLAAGGLDLARANTVVGAPTMIPVGASCISTVNIQVQYTHPTPFLSGIMGYFGSSFGTLTLRGTSSMRTEVAAGACP